MTAANSPTFRAKTFLAFQRWGLLSTLSRDTEGYPFGSLVPYDISSTGLITISISRLAEHFHNLSHNPRASICVVDRFAWHNPASATRATAIGEFLPVLPENHQHVANSYWERFPVSPQRQLAQDFVFFQMQPQRIRLIAGFGDIRWISGKAFSEAELDNIAYASLPYVEHWNETQYHKFQTLLETTGVEPQESKVQLRFLGASHAEFSVGTSSPVTFAFTSALKSPSDFAQRYLGFNNTAGKP